MNKLCVLIIGAACAVLSLQVGAEDAGSSLASRVAEARKAADQGDAVAQNNLGSMYDVGEGVTEDDAEAVKWYRKAADQGHVSAQYRLGYMYEEGQGVPQDYAEAAKWYRKAADQGYAYAQGNLGLMYQNGQGVSQDYVMAHMYYNIASATALSNCVWADAGGSDAARKYRDRIAKIMTGEQVAEAQRLAREWMERFC